MKMRFAYAFLILMLSPQMALSTPKEWNVLSLPPTIETEQEIKTIPAGWEASIAAGSIHLGRPENRASLVPDSEEQQKAKNAIIATWQFDSSTSESIWISVSYSATSVVLAKSLPRDTREFRVTYDTSVTVDGLNEIKRAEYR